eukprot:CAMPEP_0172201032 /NCGR_PEP_ID=MMETSP1050-20130122/29726_1 /TAXON_ID=233186 /ORGANISM="Cryptomonas curvata, Strain CCAP979/52" /LENGTH=95 /DNA_ID=CAMNT_0012878537 /DNA_START=12 /DNA_END=299 /DNA_ORIENTATION=-
MEVGMLQGTAEQADLHPRRPLTSPTSTWLNTVRSIRHRRHPRVTRVPDHHPASQKVLATLAAMPQAATSPLHDPNAKSILIKAGLARPQQFSRCQ